MQDMIAKTAGSIEECMLAKKLSKKEEHIYKETRLAEILYGNLNHGYWRIWSKLNLFRYCVKNCFRTPGRIVTEFEMVILKIFV